MKWFWIALLFVSFNAFGEIKLQGADGHWTILSKPATRVVSLSPNVTEMLFAIGMGSKIVAVSEDSDYPSVAKKLPDIGGYKTINDELIVALHANLAVAWKGANSASEIATLRRLGIPVLVLGANSLVSIPQQMILLGRATGHIGSARGQAHLFLKQFAYLVQKYSLQKPRLPVFVQLGYPPLYAAGKGSLLNRIVNVCGGENIFADIPTPGAPVSIESVLKRNPAVIIEVGKQLVPDWTVWPTLKAAKLEGISEINASVLARPGPRLIQGATKVCEVIERVRKQMP